MNAMPEVYACVCVRELPAQALLRLRPASREQRCVVLDGLPPLLQVCALNARARLAGLRHGMTGVEVETFAEVVALTRSHAAESALRAILLECLSAFSPRIEDHSSDHVWLGIADIAGTEQLFGPPQSLAQQMRARLRSVGVLASVTISANLHTALCLARGQRSGTPTQVVARGQEAVALAPLPVAVLGLSAAQATTLEAWGVRTVGALAALPETALIARLGQDARRLLELAHGKRAHLLQPVEVPFVLEEQIELDSPLDDLESLLFGLSTMLEQLMVRARSRILALATVTITLRLEDGASHQRSVSPRLATNDKRLWLKLLHLELQAHPPAAAIVAVHLHAEPGSTSTVQLGLFAPQLPEPGRLDVALARIRAIVGDANVGRAVLDDTWRAEDFHLAPFALPASAPQPADTASPLCLRWLRPAERIRVEVERGQPQQLHFRTRRYAVEQAYGPWLYGGDWWSEHVWGQEQWDVVARAADRALLACRLARDLLKDHWSVAALYD